MKSKSKTKIVFMGGNLIACSILRHLLRLKDIKISMAVGCYYDNGSVIDPKAWNASFARVALTKGIPFVQPKSPRNLQFINDIQRIDKPDFIITAGYDQILDPVILSIPKQGSINIHFSPLPLHRGHFPIAWSILKDQTAGVTMHWINNEINGGNIIAQETIPIRDLDTSFSIYSSLTKSGIKLFKKFFPQVLNNSAPSIQQDETKSTYHPAGYPYQRIINWNNTSKQIDRLIRALTFPGFEPARTFYQNLEISILDQVEIVTNTAEKKHPPGTILDISLNGILVQTEDYPILIKKTKIGDSIPINAYKLSKLFCIYVNDSFRSYENLSSEGKLNLIVP